MQAFQQGAVSGMYTRSKASLVPPDFKECCKDIHENYLNLNKKYRL